MKYCGVVTDRSWMDSTFGESWIAGECYRSESENPDIQGKRIYSDEVPRPDRNFMRALNNQLPHEQLLMAPEDEERFLNQNRLEEWRAKFLTDKEKRKAVRLWKTQIPYTRYGVKFNATRQR